MSETVKLIIEIPKVFYERCKADEDAVEIRLAVKNGIPLDSNDSDYAEAQAYFAGMSYGWGQGQKALIEEVKAEIENRSYGIANDSVIQGEMYERHAILEIIDNIGKGDSECSD